MSLATRKVVKGTLRNRYWTLNGSALSVSFRSRSTHFSPQPKHHSTKASSGKSYLFLFVCKQESDNEIHTRLLVGYCIRGKQRLLTGTLTAITIVVCFIVLLAIALSQLPYQLGANDSRDLSKTFGPCGVGLNYKTAQIKLMLTALCRTTIRRITSTCSRLKRSCGFYHM
jgi:hypothetical protein